MKTAAEAKAYADQLNARLPEGEDPWKPFLNKRSTHTRKTVTVLQADGETPEVDENGDEVTKLAWVKKKNAEPEYVVAKVQLEHYIAAAFFLLGVAMTVAHLFGLVSMGAEGFMVAALSGTGLYDSYVQALLEASPFTPPNLETMTNGLLGINSTGEGAGDETTDQDLADTPYLSGNRAHGITALTVSVTTPVQLTWRCDATDLSGTFTDNNGANDTSSLVFYYEAAAADASRWLLWYSVLSSDVAQDGTDDDVTFNASGLFQIAA